MRQTTKSLEAAVHAAHEADQRTAAKLAALISWSENLERHLEERRRDEVAAINEMFGTLNTEIRQLRGELDALRQELTGPPVAERPQISLVAGE